MLILISSKTIIIKVSSCDFFLQLEVIIDDDDDFKI